MKSLFSLNHYFLKYSFHFFFGIVFVTISVLFAIYPAQLTRITIDYLVESKGLYQVFKESSLQPTLFNELATVFLLFFGLVVISSLVKGMFMFFMRQTIIVMSRHVEFDQKNDVFQHYQKLNLSFYKRNNTGDLMSRISEDVSQVRMYVGPAIMYSINLIVTFILVIIAMLRIDIELTLYTLLPLPVLSYGVYKVSSIINFKSSKIQGQLGKLSTVVQEAFSGIRVLKAFNREKYSAEQFEKESDAYKQLSLNLVKTDAYFQPIIALLIGLSTLLTIYIGGKQAIAGKISIGNIAEFVMYLSMLTWPVTAMGWVTSIIQRAAASQTRINEFLHIKPEIDDSQTQVVSISESIELRNVSFVYPDTGIKALNAVSFELKKGESLGIIGRTGSGKSTLANLLCRLYDPSEGSILIDKIDLTEINLNSYRQCIGYVPQEVFLFSDSIKNNIAFGLKEDLISEHKIHEAAKQAVVYDSIDAFPDKFEARLGERGITLSGGQKQRVSIARALIKSPALLIFDDCLSAVDTETEAAILYNLRQEMKNKFSVIISHRVSSVSAADKIIVLDEGKVCEQGSHTELLAAKGVYHDLYRKQLVHEN
ncbi:MAG: ABC transporter ATP-binding protein [Bacteroidetes bacterium]|nr:ABC transporter ATP-binding protein [Bacteroidota bacterium]MBK9799959.1 ABC transporter ATP-binding protein [Bacteroidota bacterium]MBP6413893.1 ABC transporter ATP-binding protein [Bacteroidia bacterium]